MKYIKPSFQEIKEENFFNKIGLVAHNCYQVENNDNAELFVRKLMSYKHFAMIEHHRFLFEVDKSLYDEINTLNNPFISLGKDNDKYYISCSLRPLLENYKTNKSISKIVNLLDDQIISLFEDFNKENNKQGKLIDVETLKESNYNLYQKFKYVSLKIITDRGVTHELVRHRIASYAQESTRYCNYGKNKYGNELTFIQPLNYEEYKQDYDSIFSSIETEYIKMVNEYKMKAELARSILPNKLKASIIITASIEEYIKIFELRCALNAHPDMREIMLPIQDYFYDNGYINEKTI